MFVPDEEEVGRVSYTRGDRWTGRSAPILSLWEKLGYVEKTSSRKLVCVWNSVDLIKRMLSGSLSPVYHFVVVRTVPEKLRVCLSRLPHVPLRDETSQDVPSDMWSFWSDSDSDISSDELS